MPVQVDRSRRPLAALRGGTQEAQNHAAIGYGVPRAVAADVIVGRVFA